MTRMRKHFSGDINIPFEYEEAKWYEIIVSSDDIRIVDPRKELNIVNVIDASIEVAP